MGALDRVLVVVLDVEHGEPPPLHLLLGVPGQAEQAGDDHERVPARELSDEVGLAPPDEAIDELVGYGLQ